MLMIRASEAHALQFLWLRQQWLKIQA